ncbi:MAG: phage tail assembly protein [Sulfitobacter sp.]
MSVENMNKITLHAPIKDNGEEITAITLTRPNSGHLRGLKLLDLAQMDVTQVTKLLPRISRPRLSPEAVAQIDPIDLMTLSAAISGFFFAKDQIDNERALMNAEIEEADFVPLDTAAVTAKA